MLVLKSRQFMRYFTSFPVIEKFIRCAICAYDVIFLHNYETLISNGKAIRFGMDKDIAA